VALSTHSGRDMTDSYLSKLLRLRFLVGYLGERAQFSWWPTSFYESSARLFLEPVFAKTARLAQYHGVVEAARRLHDEHLSVGSYHLFRLPEEVEQDLHRLIGTDEGEGLAPDALQSKQAALDALKAIAPETMAKAVGPTAVGRIADLYSADTSKAIAGVYWSAFSQNVMSYPYLATHRGR
jgi:hypothetical protein